MVSLTINKVYTGKYEFYPFQLEIFFADLINEYLFSLRGTDRYTCATGITLD